MSYKPTALCKERELRKKAEQERDEAREALKHIEEYGTEEINAAVELRQKLATALLERDEVKEKLSDWENSALQVEADHPDEVHCGCVSVLRKLLNDARSERDEARELLASEKITRDHVIKRGIEMQKERDEAREALMKIEDLFIDGTDIYADRENMGIIARNALEGAK
jgi:hypothetical protein